MALSPSSSNRRFISCLLLFFIGSLSIGAAHGQVYCRCQATDEWPCCFLGGLLPLAIYAATFICLDKIRDKHRCLALSLLSLGWGHRGQSWRRCVWGISGCFMRLCTALDFAEGSDVFFAACWEVSFVDVERSCGAYFSLCGYACYLCGYSSWLYYSLVQPWHDGGVLQNDDLAAFQLPFYNRGANLC